MADEEYERSESLAALDSEIASTEARLQVIQRERGEALTAKTKGTEGADQTLADLRDERTRLENDLGDVREARKLEAQRLKQAHAEAIAQAQEARRAEIKQAVGQVRKASAKVDKGARAIIDALQELEKAGSELARVHGRGAGNSVSREAMRVVQDRLQEYSGGSRFAPANFAVDRMPDESAVETAAIPDTLAELPDAQ